MQVGRFIAVVCAAYFLSRPQVGTALLNTGFKAEKASFALHFHEEASFYRVTPIFALPSEEVVVSVFSPSALAKFALVSESGSILSQTVDSFVWKAPATPGYYPLEVKDVTTGETIQIQAFVMIPFEKAQQGVLNGYKIGRYPRPNSKRESIYPAPRGFIEVTEANKNVQVTPHFKLSQFLCKQTGGYPKYVVLRERLLFKLEYVLEQVNVEGIPAKTFTVMSGYRTPFYNASIDNVKFSRHVWGDAADIFVDDDGDNYMDDLNSDRRADHRDAEVLYNLVSSLNERPAFLPFVGGLGRYRSTENHGPFVHVDARGVTANWKN